MLTKNDLLKNQEKLSKQKEALLLKKNRGTATKAELEQLNAVVAALVDIEEELSEAKTSEAKAHDTSAVEQAISVNPKEAHLYHIKLSRGQRFDPNTGKEINAPFIQKFTKKEYAQLKTTARSLGLVILAELHKPV